MGQVNREWGRREGSVAGPGGAWSGRARGWAGCGLSLPTPASHQSAPAATASVPGPSVDVLLNFS